MSSPNESRPLPIPFGSTPGQQRPQSPSSYARGASNARLASPVPSYGARSGPRRPHSRNASAGVSGTQTPLAGSAGPFSLGPGHSALATALRESDSRALPVSQTPPVPSDLPRTGSGLFSERRPERTNYGSFGAASGPRGSGWASPAPYEDFEVVRRHLAGPPSVQGAALDGAPGSPRREMSSTLVAQRRGGTEAQENQEDGFSSLKMQGGDITRGIYRRTEAEVNARQTRQQRSKSLSLPRPDPEDEELDIENMRQPGGFRRNHIIRNAPGPLPHQLDGSLRGQISPPLPQPNLLTRNFFEFLSLYGHFAGEDVDDDEFESSEGESPAPGLCTDSDYDQDQERSPTEQRPLLKRSTTLKRRRTAEQGPKKGAAGTVFILLKSFVGTGVLFLPRAFLNGGMLFSFFILLGVACLCYYCFVLLTTSRLVLKGSFADMGEMTYGKFVRFLISTSLVVSQVGFSSAYIVFTSENLQAFVLAVSHCRTYIDIKLMILMQLIVFLPLSLYRNLNNISFVVYTADVFIVLGLVYLYYYGIATLALDGISDIVLFNRRSWTLFIGTAIFTFEGIGLLIPIQDGMKNPAQLPKVLGGVMVIISLIFITMGALSYAAYGSKTETVIILNMPQDNKFVNGVQFLYSFAILLSTPMQIFPAITIMEKGIFTKSGKFSRFIKWRKNLFRFCVVIGSALIAWVGAGDLDKFVALVGSFACVPLVYIYPPLIHRKAVAGTRWSRAVDATICIFGILLMVYTSIMTIRSWVTGSSERAPRYCDKGGM